MKPEALVLVHEDILIQKLLVTWPTLVHNRPPRPLGAPPPALKYQLALVRPMFHEWSRVSGIDEAVIEEKAPMLFANDICREDGTTASEALSFVSTRMLRETVRSTGPVGRPKKTA